MQHQHFFVLFCFVLFSLSVFRIFSLFRLLAYTVHVHSNFRANWITTMRPTTKKGFECSFSFLLIWCTIWGLSLASISIFSCAPFFSTHHIHIVCLGPGNYDIHINTSVCMFVSVWAATWFKKEKNYRENKHTHMHTKLFLAMYVCA